MRKHGSYFLVLLFAIQTAALHSQTPEKPAPQFILTVLENHDIGPSFNRVTVRMANISNEVVTEPGCAESRGLYILSVLYNGVPLEEKDAAGRRRREAKDAQFCTRELGINEVKPGESIFHWFAISSIYDVSKPGTYEVTVSRETFPDEPDKSVTVKSNTLTVVVPPDPPAADPK
jgi:hypothetical protein